MNLRERVARTPPPSANKAVDSGFETQRRRHQKSKTGVSISGPTKRTYVLQNFLLRKGWSDNNKPGADLEFREDEQIPILPPANEVCLSFCSQGGVPGQVAPRQVHPSKQGTPP